MSLETRLARVRGLGSAKDGTHHWWAQRLTAVALVPLTVWFAVSVAGMAGAGADVAAAWVGAPLNTVLLLLLIAATLYVPPPLARSRRPTNFLIASGGVTLAAFVGQELQRGFRRRRLTLDKRLRMSC